MIRTLIYLYTLIIIANTILSYIPNLANQDWVIFLRKLANYTLTPTQGVLKKVLPPDMPFDISPLVVITLFQLILALW
jgi:YggT family protein